MERVDAVDGSVTGGVRLLLRAEGTTLFAGATAVFFWLGNPWWLFVLLFLTPDLSFLGYLAGPRAGAATYNTVHATIGPICLCLAGAANGNATVLALALIWAAHVGLDRALGYGLKYETAFGRTHLGKIGRDR